MEADRPITKAQTMYFLGSCHYERLLPVKPSANVAVLTSRTTACRSVLDAPDLAIYPRFSGLTTECGRRQSPPSFKAVSKVRPR